MAAARAAHRAQRRFRTLNLTMFLPLLAAVGALVVGRQSRSLADAVVLGIGLAAALLAFERWTAGELSRVAIPCVAVAAAVWPYGVLAIGGEVQAAYFPLAVIGALAVHELPQDRRIAAAAGLVAYVAGVGVLGYVVEPGTGADALVDDVILPTGITAVLVGVMFPNKRFYDVVAEMEEARDREAELAVARERVRFASDLHDIQGHTLHVVKLKIALAQRLLHSDIARVEEELREMYALVGATITQTKELADGRQTLNITAELQNATNLLEAVDIAVQIDSRPGAETPASGLLAQVLRETTTNILRHTRATQVRIALSGRHITVVNDGVIDDELPELRGLAALSRRIAEEGGSLTVELVDGRFVTAATFAAELDDRVPAAIVEQP